MVARRGGGARSAEWVNTAGYGRGAEVDDDGGGEREEAVSRQPPGMDAAGALCAKADAVREPRGGRSPPMRGWGDGARPRRLRHRQRRELCVARTREESPCACALCRSAAARREHAVEARHQGEEARVGAYARAHRPAATKKSAPPPPTAACSAATAPFIGYTKILHGVDSPPRVSFGRPCLVADALTPSYLVPAEETFVALRSRQERRYPPD